jgi:hypothetical protein
MKFLLPWAIAVAFTATLWQAPAAQSKKSTSSTKKTSTKKSTAKTTASKKSKKGAPKGVTWRNRQTAPAPERYKEIQDALVAKGFLKPEDANGTWGPTSVDALRQFQASQSIEANGKINSLSLIALGLGPKYETAAPKVNQ